MRFNRIKFINRGFMFYGLVSLSLFALLFLLPRTYFSDNAIAKVKIENEVSAKNRLYQVVFIYMKDQVKFGEYIQKVGPIVSKYGGTAERVIIPESIYPEMAQPDAVNIVYYDSEEAYHKFENDPDFKKLEHLRSEAIDMKGVNVKVIGGELIDGEVGSRPYMVEFVYFQDGKPANFRSYQKKAKPMLEEYGFHVERTFKPISTFGDMKMPDEVNIYFYETAEGEAKAHQDPRLPELQKMYGAALSDLIWIKGKAFVRK